MDNPIGLALVLLIIFGLSSIMLSSTISQAEDQEQNRGHHD